MGIINGKRVCLRPICLSDSSLIVSWRNSIQIKRFFLFQDEITIQDQNKWISEQVDTGHVVQWIISVHETGTDIGSVYLRDIDYNNKKCQLGIFIGEQRMQSQGYGSEACKLVVDYAFSELKIAKVYLKLLSSNTIAFRTYEKIGFAIEGNFLMDYWIDGSPVDVTYMAKYSPDLHASLPNNHL